MIEKVEKLENLKALVYKNVLNPYQKHLARKEFEKLVNSYNDLIDFKNKIKEICNID